LAYRLRREDEDTTSAEANVTRLTPNFVSRTE